MKILYLLFIFTITTLNLVTCVDPELEDEEIRARSYLQYLNDRNARRTNKQFVAGWDYESNITEATLQHKLSIESEAAKETKEDWQKTIKFNWKSYRDPDLRRQFMFYSILGEAALPDDKFEKNGKIISDMKSIYSTAKLCQYKNNSNCNLSLEPDLIQIFASSRNADELKYYWVQWRNAVGPKVKAMYKEYVDLQNEIAHLNNFTDNSEFWNRDFESDDFRDQVHNLWEQLKPLYLQIHAYIRFQLHKKYGDCVPKQGPIPAHLLGNVWSQSWNNINDFTLPHPGKEAADVTHEMTQQGYTPLKMFQMANDFFGSLNLTEMPSTFWKRSILEKPTDGRELVCHASAWDFFTASDVRIKQCTRVNEEDFYTAHHEMGHAEYFLQYSRQPAIYREGANSGFHEAVGDTISLSVSTTKHLRKIGLIKSEDDDELLLNKLYTTGLDKIVFLPYAYLLDLWRWDVFSGKVTFDNWNCHYWKLRNEYQGLEPPVNRTENDFDPASKFHVVADVPYIRYFVSFVIQFQFHRALCMRAGEYDPHDPTKPLHKCDIYQSTEAGNLLGKMLQMGKSRPWPDAMETITGQRYMDASALLEYFKPLHDWLEDYNNKNNIHVGWEAADNVCVSNAKQDDGKKQ